MSAILMPQCGKDDRHYKMQYVGIRSIDKAVHEIHYKCSRCYKVFIFRRPTEIMGSIYPTSFGNKAEMDTYMQKMC